MRFIIFIYISVIACITAFILTFSQVASALYIVTGSINGVKFTIKEDVILWEISDIDTMGVNRSSTETGDFYSILYRNSVSYIKVNSYELSVYFKPLSYHSEITLKLSDTNIPDSFLIDIPEIQSPLALMWLKSSLICWTIKTINNLIIHAQQLKNGKQDDQATSDTGLYTMAEEVIPESGQKKLILGTHDILSILPQKSVSPKCTVNASGKKIKVELSENTLFLDFSLCSEDSDTKKEKLILAECKPNQVTTRAPDKAINTSLREDNEVHSCHQRSEEDEIEEGEIEEGEIKDSEIKDSEIKDSEIKDASDTVLVKKTFQTRSLYSISHWKPELFDISDTEDDNDHTYNQDSISTDKQIRIAEAQNLPVSPNDASPGGSPDECDGEFCVANPLMPESIPLKSKSILSHEKECVRLIDKRDFKKAMSVYKEYIDEYYSSETIGMILKLWEKYYTPDKKQEDIASYLGESIPLFDKIDLTSGLKFITKYVLFAWDVSKPQRCRDELEFARKLITQCFLTSHIEIDLYPRLFQSYISLCLNEEKFSFDCKEKRIFIGKADQYMLETYKAINRSKTSTAGLHELDQLFNKIQQEPASYYDIRSLACCSRYYYEKFKNKNLSICEIKRQKIYTYGCTFILLKTPGIKHILRRFLEYFISLGLDIEGYVNCLRNPLVSLKAIHLSKHDFQYIKWFATNHGILSGSFFNEILEQTHKNDCSRAEANIDKALVTTTSRKERQVLYLFKCHCLWKQNKTADMNRILSSLESQLETESWAYLQVIIFYLKINATDKADTLYERIDSERLNNIYTNLYYKIKYLKTGQLDQPKYKKTLIAQQRSFPITPYKRKFKTEEEKLKEQNKKMKIEIGELSEALECKRETLNSQASNIFVLELELKEKKQCIQEMKATSKAQDDEAIRALSEQAQIYQHQLEMQLKSKEEEIQHIERELKKVMTERDQAISLIQEAHAISRHPSDVSQQEQSKFIFVKQESDNEYDNQMPTSQVPDKKKNRLHNIVKRLKPKNACDSYLNHRTIQLFMDHHSKDSDFVLITPTQQTARQTP